MAPGSDLPRPPPLASLLDSADHSVFLDFDGTLVPIAERPDAIVVPEDIAERLARLDRRLGGRVAVISGRTIADLEKHCGPLAVTCIGSHGGEWRLCGGEPVLRRGRLPLDAQQQLARFADEAGLLHEQKGVAVALHWRGTPQWGERARIFAEDLADRFGLAVKRGKCVVEIMAPGIDKGSAVKEAMATGKFSASTPVFIGDDVTDEDGFEACTTLGGFGIAVGERTSQAARYALADPGAVLEWIGI